MKTRYFLTYLESGNVSTQEKGMKIVMVYTKQKTVVFHSVVLNVCDDC